MVNTARIKVKNHRNACGFDFYVEVCNVCNRFDTSRLLLTEQVKSLEDLLHSVVDDTNTQDSGLDLPEELLQLDNRRYSAVKALKNVSCAYGSHFNPVKSKAGKQIEQLVDVHLKNIEVRCLESASDYFLELTQNLFDEPIYIQAMDLLKVTDIAQEMSFCNRQFIDKFESAEIDKTIPNRMFETEIYSSLRVAYEQIIDRIQALMVINTMPDYERLLDEISQISIAHGAVFERTTTPIYY